MPDTINVRDLTDEQVDALEKLAELFRRRAKKRRKASPKGEKGEDNFTYHPSTVTGNLTRREIYEDL